MSLEAVGAIYTGPNQTGQSSLIGLAKGNRYSHANKQALQSIGFYQQIQSGFIDASANVDISMMIFTGDSFDGSFYQFTDPQNGGETTFATNSWKIGSYLLLGSSPGGANQIQLSYKNIFQKEWDSTIDQQLGSSAYRNGEPVLTWDMFPTNEYSWLNSNLPYLKVHQDVVIKISCWPSNYNAWMEYWLYLYPSGGNIRASVAGYAWWVEGGTWNGSVSGKFGPLVVAGMTTLQDQLNTQLSGYDGITNGKVLDIFYLPGSQTSPPSAAVQGSTTDDVTIVILL
jgi:hypothetical protein